MDLYLFLYKWFNYKLNIKDMSCNCKKKINVIDKKYGDVGNSSGEEKLRPLLMVILFITQILFGLLCGAIMIVLIVPMIIYIIICLMFGRETKIRLINPKKLLKKRE